MKKSKKMYIPGIEPQSNGWQTSVLASTPGNLYYQQAKFWQFVALFPVPDLALRHFTAAYKIMKC